MSETRDLIEIEYLNLAYYEELKTMMIGVYASLENVYWERIQVVQIF